MGISIDKLQFDPSAPAENQRVGSFLIGANGTVITETGTSLDVNISNSSIAVTAADLDIRDLQFASDSVDVSGSSVSISGDVNVTQGTDPWIVSAADFDIRDLSFATDKVDVTGSEVSLDAATLAALEEITAIVDGSFDEDSAHASGDKGLHVLNVRSDIPQANTSANGDYASLQSDNKGRLWVNDSANSAASYGALSITNTAAEFLGSPLSGRKLLLLQNLGSQDVYIGFNNSVTSSNGIQLPKFSSIELPFGDNLDIYMVTAAGTANVRYAELA
jgi:hypothetical protein